MPRMRNPRPDHRLVIRSRPPSAAREAGLPSGVRALAPGSSLTVPPALPVAPPPAAGDAATFASAAWRGWAPGAADPPVTARAAAPVVWLTKPDGARWEAAALYEAAIWVVDDESRGSGEVVRRGAEIEISAARFRVREATLRAVLRAAGEGRFAANEWLLYDLRTREAWDILSHATSAARGRYVELWAERRPRSIPEGTAGPVDPE